MDVLTRAHTHTHTRVVTHPSAGAPHRHVLLGPALRLTGKAEGKTNGDKLNVAQIALKHPWNETQQEAADGMGIKAVRISG